MFDQLKLLDKHIPDKATTVIRKQTTNFKILDYYTGILLKYTPRHTGSFHFSL